MRFARNEVYPEDKVLRSYRLRRKFFHLAIRQRYIFFITFFAHSLTQQMNSLSHLRTYSRLAFSLSLRTRFSTGKYLLTGSLISVRNRSEFRRETRWFEDADLRSAPVENQLTNNCTALVLRSYMLPRQMRTWWDTSVVPDC